MDDGFGSVWIVYLCVAAENVQPVVSHSSGKKVVS